jgi:hypothetical protein
MNSSTAVRSKRTAFPNLRLGSTGRLTPEACESTQRAETPSQSATSCAVSSLSGRAEVFACGYAVVAAAGLKGERVAPMPFLMPLSQAQSKVFRLPRKPARNEACLETYTARAIARQANSRAEKATRLGAASRDSLPPYPVGDHHLRSRHAPTACLLFRDLFRGFVQRVPIA